MFLGVKDRSPAAAPGVSGLISFIAPAGPRLPEATALSELLDATDAGPADRVLMLCDRGGAEAMSVAMRRGCRGIAAITRPPRNPFPAQVVVATGLGTRSAAAIAADIALASFAAAGTEGRVALGMVGEIGSPLALSVVTLLRAAGFRNVRLRADAAGGSIVLAILPKPEPGAPEAPPPGQG